MTGADLPETLHAMYLVSMVVTDIVEAFSFFQSIFSCTVLDTLLLKNILMVTLSGRLSMTSKNRVRLIVSTWEKKSKTTTLLYQRR